MMKRVIKKLVTGIIAGALVCGMMVTSPTMQVHAMEPVAVETGTQVQEPRSTFGCTYEIIHNYETFNKMFNKSSFWKDFTPEKQAMTDYVHFVNNMIRSSGVPISQITTTNEGFPLPLNGYIKNSFTGPTVDVGMYILPQGLTDEQYRDVRGFLDAQKTIYEKENIDSVNASIIATIGEGAYTDITMYFLKDFSTGLIVGVGEKQIAKLAQPGVYELYAMHYHELRGVDNPNQGWAQFYKVTVLTQ